MYYHPASLSPTPQEAGSGASTGRPLVAFSAALIRASTSGGFDPDADPRRAATTGDCALDRLRHRSARQYPMQGVGSEGGRCARRIFRQQLVDRLNAVQAGELIKKICCGALGPELTLTDEV
jgi:hypothetical protein